MRWLRNMSAQEDEKQQRDNWLKVSLFLHYMKEGLERFTECRASAFHQHLCSSLQNAHGTGFTQISCSLCNPSSFYKKKVNCPFCAKWIEELLKYHCIQSCAAVSWANTNPQAWVSDPWEVAKVYLPKGCHDNRSAADSDSAALLTLLSSCKFFHKFHKDQALVEEVKDIRNKIVHCGSFYVTNKDRDEYIGRMLDLLNNIRNIRNVEAEERECADKAYSKIDKLRHQEIDVILDKQLESLAFMEHMSEIAKSVSDVQEKLAECNQDIDSLKTETKDVQSLRDDLEKTTADIRILKGQVLELSGHLDNVAAIKSQTSQLQSLEQSLQSLKQDMSELSGKFETEISRRETFLGPTASTSECQWEVSTKGRQLCSSCHPAKASVEQDTGPVDMPTAEVMALQTYLRSIYTKYCQLTPIYPLMPHRRFPVEKLYVKPNMKIVAPDYRPGNKMHLSSSVLKENVDSYRDVFYTDGASVGNIYITGDAGVGKSTLCEHMVNLWCQSKNPDDPGRKASEDEEIMSHFTLVFYLSLRESVAERSTVDNDSVEDMIRRQLGVTKYDIGRMLKDERCLVILDGLDEWAPKSDRPSTRFESKDLPRRPLDGKFTVVTTSRPWKLEVLRAELEGRIDKQINIEGLGQKAVSDLVKNAIGVLKKEGEVNEKSAENFFKDLRTKDVDIQKILETPVLLLQLVCLWYDDKPLEASLVELYSNMIIRQLLLAEGKPLLPLPDDEHRQAQFQLPHCLKANATCHKYSKLLISLSELAYAAFLSKCRETALVFDHRQTEIHGMCSTDVERCMRIGLLTQNKMLGKITEENKRISFIHKTFQEFFAAVYIAAHMPIVGVELIFPEDSCTLDLVLEMEKVFVFVCGMNAEAGEALITFILKQVSQNETIKSYRKSIEKEYDPTAEYILRVQGMILDCLQEAGSNGLDVCLPIDDLTACSDCDIDILSRIGSHWDRLSTNRVKTICMVTPSECLDATERRDIRKIFGCTKNSDCLERIYLFDWGSCIEANYLFDAIYRSRTTLKSVALLNIQISSLEQRFCDVMQSVTLEAFGLEGYGYGWGNLMTHDQLASLPNVLSKICTLKRLRIEETFCATHRDCQFDLKLSCNQHLEELYLDNLYANNVELDVSELKMCELRHLHVSGATSSLCRCLKGATRLHHLIIRGFNDISDVETLVNVLPHLTSLRRLSFGAVNFEEPIGERFNINIPRTLEHLELVQIRSMTLTNSCLRSFVDSIPVRKIEVRLRTITVKHDNAMEDAMDYIRQSQKFVILQDRETDWLCFSPI